MQIQREARSCDYFRKEVFMTFEKCSYCGELQHVHEIKEQTENYYRTNGHANYAFNKSDSICPSCGIPMDQGSY